MVAELIPETEQKQPEDAALTNPDSTQESTEQANDQQEDTSHIDAFLEGLGSDDADTSTDDGKGATTDGTAPSTEKPAATREEIRQELEAEDKVRREAENLKTYRDGVSRSFQSVDGDLMAKAKEWGLDLDQADWLKERFRQHNGHWNVLYQAALEQASPQIESRAYQRAEGEVSKQLLDTIAEELGDAKALTGEIGKSIKTWPDMAKALVKEARKGYVTKDEVTKGQRKVLDRIDTALKGRGMSLKDITGNGGSDLPPIRGAAGSLNTAQALDKAYGNGEIDAATYRARYKAVTGVEP